MTKCGKCGKSVYAMEEVMALGKKFHGECLTCHRCNKRLSNGDWEEYQGKIHCNHCHNNYVVDKETQGQIAQMEDSRNRGLGRMTAKALPGFGARPGGAPMGRAGGGRASGGGVQSRPAPGPKRAMPSSMLANIRNKANGNQSASTPSPIDAKFARMQQDHSRKAAAGKNIRQTATATRTVEPVVKSTPAPAAGFCGECGAKADGSFCSKCGAVRKQGEGFQGSSRPVSRPVQGGSRPVSRAGGQRAGRNNGLW